MKGHCLILTIGLSIASHTQILPTMALKQLSVSDIETLDTLFQNDDISGLTGFINSHKQYDWALLAKHPHAGLRTNVTPLIAATFCGAINCVKTLFQYNPDNFAESLTKKGSTGFMPLHYAQNQLKNFPTQKKYKDLVAFLQSPAVPSQGQPKKSKQKLAEEQTTEPKDEQKQQTLTIHASTQEDLKEIIKKLNSLEKSLERIEKQLAKHQS